MLCRGGRGWSWVSLLSPPQRWARLSMAVAPCVLLLPLPGPFPVHGPCHAQPHCSHPWPHSCGGNGCWTRSSRRTSRKTRRWCCWPWTTCSRCPSSSAPHPAGTTAHLSLQAPFLHPTSVWDDRDREQGVEREGNTAFAGNQFIRRNNTRPALS